MKIPKLLKRLIRPIINKFPTLKLMLIKIGNKLKYRSIRKEKPSLTKFGFYLVGNENMIKGYHEIFETKLLLVLLDQVDVFINVGANIGYYCCIALQRGKKTIAIEPVNSNLQVLYRNMIENGWENKIEIHPIAIGNHNGITKIFGEGTGASLIKGWAGISENYYTFVPILTLDSIIANRFTNKKCLILADIEGAERMLIEGALQILKQDNTIWILEISTTQNQPSGIDINPNLIWTFEEFWNHGYQSRAIIEGLPKVSPNDVEKSFINRKNYLGSHNFLFHQPRDNFKLFKEQ